MYDRPFDGKRPFYHYIKHEPKILIRKTQQGEVTEQRDVSPCGGYSIAGISFGRATARQMTVDHEGETWKALGYQEPGGLIQLTYKKLQQIREAAGQYVVRWLGSHPDQTYRYRVEIYNLLACYMHAEKNKDGEWPSEKVYMHDREEQDVPFAQYLVLLPKEYVDTHGGRENLQSMPSMLDIDPATGECER